MLNAKFQSPSINIDRYFKFFVGLRQGEKEKKGKEVKGLRCRALSKGKSRAEKRAEGH